MLQSQDQFVKLKNGQVTRNFSAVEVPFAVALLWGAAPCALAKACLLVGLLAEGVDPRVVRVSAAALTSFSTFLASGAALRTTASALPSNGIGSFGI